MILPSPKDAIHKAWLYRLLTAICDEPTLANNLSFKGGTCAAMLGFLNRFSVDLDFDYVGKQEELNLIKAKLENIFEKLGLTIKDKSINVPQYFLKYPVADENQRNTIEVDVSFPPPKNNIYQAVRFEEIDRVITCQTKETMFANKLVALIDRYERNGSIAGRDLYDIHYFFLRGFKYNQEVIKERRGTDVETFFEDLIKFIEDKITETILTQDLNFLLPPKEFSQIRKILKQEVLIILKDELTKLK